MLTNVEQIKKTIKPILDKYGIKKAGLFGSFARNEEVYNDIDLVVKIEKRISLLQFISIKQDLEDVLGIKVDLVEYNAIHPLLKDQILKDEVSVL